MQIIKHKYTVTLTIIIQQIIQSLYKYKQYKIFNKFNKNSRLTIKINANN
jgi:hypothetical protein